MEIQYMKCPDSCSKSVVSVNELIQEHFTKSLTVKMILHVLTPFQGSLFIVHLQLVVI